MKEEAKGKKLPPKMLVGSSLNSTPTKLQNDEILGTLLRINNFDSISSIKDESLDIDLSACVTICADTSTTISGNSLSSTDFWRVLDESAQNPQLDMVEAQVNGYGETNILIKDEHPNTFSGTFIRPETPVNSTSPFKKLTTLPAELFQPSQQKQLHHQQRNNKPSITNQSIIATIAGTTPATTKETKKQFPLFIKKEPPEQDDKLNSISCFKSTSQISIAELINSTKEVETTQEVSHTPPVLHVYKCLDCDKILPTKEESNNHQVSGHRIVNKCGWCDREFEQESGLKKHLKSHRTVEARKDAWKKCPDCGKSLKLGSLWMHRKIHTENKKYGCEICGQKFVQKINLTHHSRIHITEKPFECPECQKRFQERSHLQRHQKYHAQTRSYRCEKCGKMYKTERCLKVHNLVHLEQRPFACNVCNKSFISNSKLKQHSNIHTGNRPFKCNYCPRDFTNFPNWLKHTRRRHKVDHKTGEHLEKIPSYCSKKSTKTPKTQKPKDAITINNIKTTNQPNSISSNSLNIATVTNVTKIPNQKIGVITTKTIQNDNVIQNSVNIPKKAKVEVIAIVPKHLIKTDNESSTGSTTSTIGTITSNITLTPITKAKVKRERKQSTPKQVQKSPTITTIVKKEVVTVEPTKTPNKANCFPDLNGLSLTAAEDLIMEQALEMEESGLYNAEMADVPSTTDPSGNTDNAISAETAAALRFKIKSEFPLDKIKEEEFIPLNGAKNPAVFCSSLESSPFSSPASLEITSSVLNETHQPQTASVSNEFGSSPVPIFFLPSNFTLNLPETNRHQLTTASTSTDCSQIIPSSGELARQYKNGSTNVINNFFFPMTMSMPLLQTNSSQVLPSVDTLLSSHSVNNGFLRSAGATPAEQNLS